MVKCLESPETFVEIFPQKLSIAEETLDNENEMFEQ
jgi:hypothetical protein